jgi:hypothetical protein
MSSFNRQYSDPPFGMSQGIAHTGAPGTRGAGGRAPDDMPAGEVTPPGGVWQDRPVMDTSGTLQPGQLTEGISGLGSGETVPFTSSTGAGDGTAGHWKRYGWQAPDGAS